MWSPLTTVTSSRSARPESSRSKSAPDFETKEDADDDNDYEVTVKVADASGESATLSVTVTVTDVDETPMIDAGSDSFAVDENTATTTIVQTYEASDVDAASNLAWTLGGDRRGRFHHHEEHFHGGRRAQVQERAQPRACRTDTVPLVDKPKGDNVYDITVTVADGSGLSSHAARDRHRQ